MPVGKHFDESKGSNELFMDVWLLEQIDHYKISFRGCARNQIPVPASDEEIYGLLIIIHNMRRADKIYRDKLAWIITGTWVVIIALVAFDLLIGLK